MDMRVNYQQVQAINLILVMLITTLMMAGISTDNPLVWSSIIALQQTMATVLMATETDLN